MSDVHYEVEIRTRDAAGNEATVHAEYRTPAATPHDAAREVADSCIKQKGNSRFREIDADH